MRVSAQRYGGGQYVAHLTEAVVEALRILSVGAGGRETGGILIGYYLDGEAWITEATLPPPDSRGGRWRFERGSAGLKAYLEEKWAAEPREYYLGEWHSHPARRAHPSHTDHRQLRQILDDPDIDCARPILIVVAGRAKPLPVFSIHVYDGTDACPVALERSINLHPKNRNST